jgi:type I restriction enzyme S subunit
MSALATERLRGAPSSWPLVSFGDVVRQVKDRVDPSTSGLDRYVAGEHMDSDRLTVRRWGRIGDGYLGPAFHMRFRPGHVLYGSRRTYLRKVAVPNFEGICANTTFVCAPSDDRLAAEFLPLVMQSEEFHSHSVAQSKGSVNPYVNWKDLAWFQFRLPPIELQRRLCKVFAAVEQSLAAWDAVERVARQSVAATASELFSAFDGSMVPCGEVCDRIRVGIVVKPAALYATEGVLALRGLNVFPNRFALDDVVYIREDAHAAHAKSQVEAGDVLIVRTGRPGDAAVAVEEVVGANCIDLIIARCGERLQPDFLARFLNSPRARRAFAAGAVGTAQKHFNVGALNRLLVPCPGRDEQDAVVGLMQQAERLVTHATVQRELTELVKRKVLVDLVHLGG